MWTNRLFLSRSRWDAAELTDPRVVHMWDERNLVGPWIVDNIGYQGADWDLYLLFGPDARWDEVPAPLVDSGFTVIGQSEKLQRAINPLLGLARACKASSEGRLSALVDSLTTSA